MAAVRGSRPARHGERAHLSSNPNPRSSDHGRTRHLRAHLTEAAGFNPYAGPSGRYEAPPTPPRRPSTNRFGTDQRPLRFWDLTEQQRDQFKREAAEQEGAARFDDLPPEVRTRYYEATWTPGRNR